LERARRPIRREADRRETVLISVLALLETEWVLRSRYPLREQEIADTVSALLDSAEVRLEEEPAVAQALYLWRDSAADFADCLVGAHHRSLGCEATASFDARAGRLPYFVAP
jgi:predicted nucleic-acid-binding protein